MQNTLISALICLFLWSGPVIAAVNPVTLDGFLGLYPANLFQVTDGEACDKCNTPKNALTLFKGETTLTPSSALAHLPPSKTPPLIWVGSGEVASFATLKRNLLIFKDNSPTLTLDLVNNPGTLATTFFENKEVKARGTLSETTFTASSIWPASYRLDLSSKKAPLNPDESLNSLTIFDRTPNKFQSRLLEGSGKSLEGLPSVAIVLSQDRLHVSPYEPPNTFAVATGFIGKNGDFSNLLVNNYQGLSDSNRIFPGAIPLDKFMSDILYGHSYYRNTYLLVAVFKPKSVVPRSIQEALNIRMRQLYQGTLTYHSVKNNGTGISVDALRDLGWAIPVKSSGVYDKLKALPSLAAITLSERSFKKGISAFELGTSEPLRVLAPVAFNVFGSNLLNLVKKSNPHSSPFERDLSDIQAVYFVKIPKISQN